MDQIMQTRDGNDNQAQTKIDDYLLILSLLTDKLTVMALD